ncbi:MULTISPECIES: branched-chain amino acid ABC transporter permease [unclassified Streptomyces]|uniref:branched-chain amino acid ABC transporter permease n=1 Tax=unclassified Streptomyces TaxID=2593676 RepID=UPI0022B6180B|nr:MULTISPECIES: branched-chain amino acid ABC transporter permease [unclassified Streptomyces]MCZ7413668.1 branched-chain amino acid ABC transporter permease [Streptomyces sp. WMMC897]MCZ7430663.1 branched-chain amino acid ABC transporter permease [Streptomyces sp. WMMC1477]
MSAEAMVRGGVAERLRTVRWYQQPRWKRLGAMIALALLATMVTGVQGSQRDLFYALEEDFTGPAPWIWLAVTVGVWAVREFAAPQVKAATEGAKAAGQGPRAWVQRYWRDRRVRWGVLGGLAALAVFVPSGLDRYWQTVLVDQIAIYVLVAIGLNVVIGWAGMLDLGFIAFFAIGAYSAAYWTGALPVAPPMELNNFAVIPVAIVTCLVAGVLLGAPTLRLRGDYLAIVTLGFHEIVYLTAKNLDDVTGGTGGAKVERFSLDLGFWSYEWGVIDPMPYYYLLLGFIAVTVYFFVRLEHSKVGRAWTAIREDEIAAASTGVDTVRYKLMAFAIGASTSGVAGVAYASKVGYINSENFIILLSVLVLAYVIFGGMGSLVGVLFGAAFLVWLPEALRDVVDPKDRYMYLGVLLVIMMIYRPQGVIPSRRRSRELKLAQSGDADAAPALKPVGGEQS